MPGGIQEPFSRDLEALLRLAGDELVAAAGGGDPEKFIALWRAAREKRDGMADAPPDRRWKVTRTWYVDAPTADVAMEMTQRTRPAAVDAVTEDAPPPPPDGG